jgi:hypothetical protein
MNLNTVRSSLALPVIALSLVACPQTATPPAIPTSNVEAHGDHVAAPTPLLAGLNTISFSNKTTGSSDLLAIQLNAGVSFNAFMAALESDGIFAAMGMGKFVGGRSVPAGETRSVIMDLEAGTYAFLTSEDPTVPEPVFTGAQVEVKARPGLAPTAPAGAVQVTAVDFQLNFPTTLPAGATTFEFRNQGTQWHEFLILKLKPGQTEADLLAFFGSPTPTEPPFEFIDIIVPVSPGKRVFFPVTLAVGNYVAVCALPDLTSSPEEPTFHVQHGMHRSFTVQ